MLTSSILIADICYSSFHLKVDFKLLYALQSFCAYRERSPLEVQRKALQLGIAASDWPQYEERLVADDCLSAHRFAQVYARSKWNQNGWGKLKIAQGLKASGISTKMTQQALQDLPESAYDEQLIAMARRKWEALKNDPQAFAKTCRYLQQKGYEPERFLPLVREWQSHQG